jgi:hypothetical protein
MTFNKVLLIPSSDNLRFITAKSDDYLTLSAARLFCRMQQQGINTQFFDLSYIQTLILPWHINYVKEKLEREQNVKINYDFKPISYYYSLRYLSSKFHSKINYLLKRVASVNFNFYQLLILVIWVALYLFRRKNVFSLYSFSMGGAGIGAVIFSIFGFQIVYGYVYHKIGLISAVFMLGVAISAYIASRKKIYHKLKWLIVLSLVNCLLFFLLPEIIENLFGLGYILQSIFFIFPLIVGILVGFAFTLANEYYLTKVPRKHRNRSFLYAFDLAGGSIIGFFLSFIAIPLYGLTDSSIIIGFMLLLSSGLMAAYSLKSNNS